MIPGLNTFLDKFEHLFGRSYLVVGLLPAVILVVFGVWVGYLAAPRGLQALGAVLVERPDLDRYLIGAALLLLLLLAGHLLWSLNAWFREVLEGAHYPPPLRRWLEAQQLRARADLQRRIDALNRERAIYRKHAGLASHEAVQAGGDERAKARQWIVQLLRARRAAERRRAGAQVYRLPPELRRRFAQMREQGRLRRRYPSREAVALFESLREQLRACALGAPRKGAPSAPRPPAADESAELLRMVETFPRLARDALVLVESEYERLWSARFYRFPDAATTLGPTAMANMAALHRNYGRQRYGMEVELIWPRMQTLVLADAGYSALIADTKVKLDFAVSMTAISALFALVGTPLVAAQGSLWLSLLVPSTALAAAALFYLLAVRAYRAFGEVLRSAIDTFRLPLLDRLCLPRPRDSRAEKAQWESLSQHTMLVANRPLRYLRGDR